MPKGSQPTQEHLAALAQGRTEGKAIRNYLQAIAANQPRKRGRQPKSADELAKLINATEDPVERIRLRPLLRDAVAREAAGTADISEIEDAFVKHVSSYSKRFGLTYADWREEGVPAALLKRAGISRGAS